VEIDNLMVMPEIEYNTNWDEEDRIWVEKVDEAYQDFVDEKLERKFYGRE